MGREDDKKVGFQIGAFFEENYKLFVIIGVLWIFKPDNHES